MSVTDYSKNSEEFRTLFNEKNILKYNLHLYKKKLGIKFIKIQNMMLKMKYKKLKKEHDKLSELNEKLRNNINQNTI